MNSNSFDSDFNCEEEDNSELAFFDDAIGTPSRFATCHDAEEEDYDSYNDGSIVSIQVESPKYNYGNTLLLAPSVSMTQTDLRKSKKPIARKSVRGDRSKLLIPIQPNEND